MTAPAPGLPKPWATETAFTGHRPTGAPLNGNRPTGAPLNGNRPTGVPLNGNRPTGVPLNGNRQPQTLKRHRLNLLGAFQLIMDGRQVTVNPSAQRLLAVLACFRRQASRAAIANALWPDSTSSRAHTNLRTLLYRLQRAQPGLVLSTPAELQLAPEVQVDIEGNRAMAIAVLNTRPGQGGHLLGRVEWTNFAEDLLPGWEGEWLSDHQHSYARLRLDALERLSELLVHARLPGAAVQTALLVIQADPFRDSAHEALIRAYLAQGNRHDAISHYVSYVELMRKELGLEPSASLGEMLWSQAA
ncbi:AfsR/SARP family transcriptional regulator [Nonomuraea candida]|uniref:AfsR/SARP family transcriptional regulator n=1 Tax=Nonomuraea candida TaxID=359159 RepID=UPI0005BCA122|nr:BTAD domain-containing putative transcriptional regulator [Nonomuraea candida]